MKPNIENNKSTQSVREKGHYWSFVTRKISLDNGRMMVYSTEKNNAPTQEFRGERKANNTLTNGFYILNFRSLFLVMGRSSAGRAPELPSGSHGFDEPNVGLDEITIMPNRAMECWRGKS